MIVESVDWFMEHAFRRLRISSSDQLLRQRCAHHLPQPKQRRTELGLPRPQCQRSKIDAIGSDTLAAQLSLDGPRTVPSQRTARSSRQSYQAMLIKEEVQAAPSSTLSRRSRRKAALRAELASGNSEKTADRAQQVGSHPTSPHPIPCLSHAHPHPHPHPHVRRRSSTGDSSSAAQTAKIGSWRRHRSGWTVGG